MSVNGNVPFLLSDRILMISHGCLDMVLMAELVEVTKEIAVMKGSVSAGKDTVQSRR